MISEVDIRGSFFIASHVCLGTIKANDLAVPFRSAAAVVAAFGWAGGVPSASKCRSHGGHAVLAAVPLKRLRFVTLVLARSLGQHQTKLLKRSGGCQVSGSVRQLSHASFQIISSRFSLLRMVLPSATGSWLISQHIPTKDLFSRRPLGIPVPRPALCHLTLATTLR